LGSVDFNNPSEEHVKLTAIEAIRHEQFNPSTLRHDIALLKLPYEVALSGERHFLDIYSRIKFQKHY